jgi:hypothetical protein
MRFLDHTRVQDWRRQHGYALADDVPALHRRLPIISRVRVRRTSCVLRGGNHSTRIGTLTSSLGRTGRLGTSLDQTSSRIAPREVDVYSKSYVSPMLTT